VLDAFNRRVVGWSMSTTLQADLVLAALNMALAVRRPSGVIHHSDQGSQYASLAFGKLCREVQALARGSRKAESRSRSAEIQMPPAALGPKGRP
jgi:transposase InsO family protein